MPKRPSGDPKPFQRKDGRWQIDVQVGRGSREHRRRVSLYGSSEADVLEKLDEHRRRDRIGLARVDEHLTIAKYLTAWADGLTGIRPRTVESYVHTVKRHLIPHLGHLTLAELAAADVRRAVRVVETKAGTRTAAYAVTILRIALNVAVRDRILERNVAGDVRRPVVDRVEHQVLNAEDARRLLAQVRGDRLEALWVLTLAAGLRRGEACGLGWAAVDLEAGTIRIERTLSYRPGDAYELTPPKTKKSKATISIPAIAVEALRAHRQRQRLERLRVGSRWREDWEATQLVFTTSTGGPLASSTTSHALHRHLAAAGLDRQRFHDLRHSTGSILLEEGVDLAYIQELLRHTDFATTRRYSHVRPTSTVTRDAMGRALTPTVDPEAEAK